jgi:hypothetical protein
MLGPAASENIWFLQDGGGRESAAREVFFWTVAGEQDIVKNAPYSGTVVNESTQTLSDGNRIISKSSGFQARDSQGRTRREETLGKVGTMQVEAPNMVFINDPVAHSTLIVMPKERTARVLKREENPENNNADGRRRLAAKLAERARMDANERGADVKHEDLGMQTIEGVACHGNRETLTIPAGQIGNEHPIVITTETWTSDDLHGIVLKKHNDPRYGETVYRLTNIKLGEPDASLFQPPSGFKILKNDASFTKE